MAADFLGAATASVYSELLMASLKEVNWFEVATFLDDE